MPLHMRRLSPSPPAAEGGEALCPLPDSGGGEPTSGSDAAPAGELPPRRLLADLLPQSTFTQTFLQSILISVDSSDPVVSVAWLETLLDVIDLLPADVIEQEILPVAVEKSQLSHPAPSRVAGCKLIGKIATKFDPYMIQTELLASVQSLCQDVSPEVRCAMSAQLGTVAQRLGPQETRAAIIPELVELASDEEAAVRLAAFRTLVDMLDTLDAETCCQTVIPLATKVCEASYDARDAALPAIARLLGKLCCGLSVYLSEEQKQTFLEFFGNVARLKSLRMSVAARNELSPMPDLVPRVETRHNEEAAGDRLLQCAEACAYNYPAMLLLAGGDLSRSGLHQTLTQLVSDPHSTVRRVIAAGFHEVCVLLGPAVHQVHGELVHLLKDDSLDVLAALVKRLPLTLEAFVKHGVLGPTAKPELVAELTAALLTCECVVANTTRWRLHASLLERLASLADSFPSDHLYHCWVPTMFQKLQTVRPIPCRQVAAQTLLVFLHSIKHPEHRHIICDRIVEELARSDSCHMRRLYLDMCHMMLDMFSHGFFKEHFFDTTLALVDDPVPNIRRLLCLLLWRLKSALRLPSDRLRLQRLEAVVRQLLVSERDRDAAAAVRTAIIQLDKIEVPLERHAPSAGADTERRLPTGSPAKRGDERTSSPVQRRNQKTNSLAEKRDQRTSYPAEKKDQRTDSPVQKRDQRTDSPVERRDQRTDSPVERRDQRTDSPVERRLFRVGRIPVRSVSSSVTSSVASSSAPRPKVVGGVSCRVRPGTGQRAPGPGSRRHSLAAEPSQPSRIPGLARLHIRDTQSEPELPSPVGGHSLPGRLSHAASLENLDPTADEFYVDAGVRMSAGSLRRLESPTPAGPSSFSRIPLRSSGGAGSRSRLSPRKK